VPKLTEMLCCN